MVENSDLIIIMKQIMVSLVIDWLHCMIGYIQEHYSGRINAGLADVVSFNA